MITAWFLGFIMSAASTEGSLGYNGTTKASRTQGRRPTSLDSSIFSPFKSSLVRESLGEKRSWRRAVSLESFSHRSS